MKLGWTDWSSLLKTLHFSVAGWIQKPCPTSITCSPSSNGWGLTDRWQMKHSGLTNVAIIMMLNEALDVGHSEEMVHWRWWWLWEAISVQSFWIDIEKWQEVQSIKVILEKVE
jgi:hypothetical protein